MAAYSGNRVVSETLSASTVDLVVLTDPGFGVRVTNLSGTSPIWFTVSHQGGPAPVPTVGGANCWCASSVAGINVPVRHDGQYGSIVQLISAGTPQYSVEITGIRVDA